MNNGQLLELIWYGERGIINSIITHMQQSKAGFVEEVKKLIKKIQWAGENPADWTNSITYVHALVELGLGQFGDPDLILVCKLDQGQKHIIFLEAKAKTYRDSMMSNFDPGMKAPGFNSSINGQLTLKYRFAQAIIAANNGLTKWVEEPKKLWKRYCNDKLSDPISAPRRLKKHFIISDILKPLMSGIKLDKSFSYVALTWDADDMAFFKDDEVTDEYLPKFLGPSDGMNLYQDMLSQIGWVNYSFLEEALGLKKNESYQLAFKSMCNKINPDKNYYEMKSRKSWEKLPEEVRSLAEELVALFNADRVRGPGSYSIKNDTGKVISKIIPRRSKVFVGFRMDYANKNFTVEKIDSIAEGNSSTVRVRGVEFTGYEVSIKNKHRDIKVARELIELWKTPKI